MEASFGTPTNHRTLEPFPLIKEFANTFKALFVRFFCKDKHNPYFLQLY